jgi:hypothetical protein
MNGVTAPTSTSLSRANCSPFENLRANGFFPNVLSEVEGRAQHERKSLMVFTKESIIEKTYSFENLLSPGGRGWG